MTPCSDSYDSLAINVDCRFFAFLRQLPVSLFQTYEAFHRFFVSGFLFLLLFFFFCLSVCPSVCLCWGLRVSFLALGPGGQCPYCTAVLTAPAFWLRRTSSDHVGFAASFSTTVIFLACLQVFPQHGVL